MAETCATCRYFFQKNPAYDGECRIKPPSFDGFPSVKPSGFCGEYLAADLRFLECSETIEKYRKMNAAKNQVIRKIMGVYAKRIGEIDFVLLDEINAIGEDVKPGA